MVRLVVGTRISVKHSFSSEDTNQMTTCNKGLVSKTNFQTSLFFWLLAKISVLELLVCLFLSPEVYLHGICSLCWYCLNLEIFVHYNLFCCFAAVHALRKSRTRDIKGDNKTKSGSG